MPPPRSQLHIDIERRISEKHNQWKRDAIHLYEMAEIPAHECLQDIFIIMIIDVMEIVDGIKMPPEEFLEYLKRSFALVKREHGE